MGREEQGNLNHRQVPGPLLPPSNARALTAESAALGTVAGGVLGASAGAGILLVLGGADRIMRGWGLIVLCAAYGASVGLFLAPLTKVLLLRDVSLHRAARHTFVGAMAGVAAGCILGPRMGYALAWPAGLGLLGFIFSAVVLRYLAGGRTAAPLVDSTVRSGHESSAKGDE